MALPWLKPYRLMGRNARSVLGIVCLLAWLVPVESWAQGSLWDDLKAMATQVARDKIKSVPEAIPNTLPSQQPAQAPITAPANARSLTADRIDYDKISDFSGQINPTVFKNETAEMRQSATGNVLILHPFHDAPAVLEKTVAVNSANTSLEFSVRGHPVGDFLARVVAVSRTGKQDVLYEKTIVGNRGWYVESIDLSRYRGQSVTLRFEAHATGWHFEYVGLDYFFVQVDGNRATYNSGGISTSRDVVPKPISQRELCPDPRTYADTDTNRDFPLCVNTPTGPLVLKNKCYQGSDEYNAKTRQFALLALKNPDGCVTYPYRGDLYNAFGNAVHAGIDFHANGVPVYAISSGTVITHSFDIEKQHSTLIIQSEDKRQKTLYLHMREMLPPVGKYVNRGDKIGIAGGIGAPFPHLHVEPVQDLIFTHGRLYRSLV